jgi:cysteine synthase A
VTAQQLLQPAVLERGERLARAADQLAADMTDEELEISRSTPNFRFDKAPDVPPARGDEVSASDEARAFVRKALANGSQPVVMFALQWCEFSWAVRKLLTRCKIAYRSIDIDSVAYQNDNWGGKIRAALTEHSGVPTIPQVFVAGRLIGGASETFTAFERGELQALLREHGIAFEDTVGDQLPGLMPGWAQSAKPR